MMSTREQKLQKQDGMGSGLMFDQIADRYDLLNRIISMGLDQGWRKKAMRSLQLQGGDLVLDLATGTADLAIMIAKNYPEVRVQGVDPSKEMLAVGQKKIDAASLQERVTLNIGDGQDLQFEDDSFDGAIIAFGIRNFPDRAAGLRELARTIKAGRKLAILELAEPDKGLLAGPAKLYVHHVVPFLGGLISGKKEYRYLQKSIAAFPPAEEFAALMTSVGFVDVQAIPMNFGVATLYIGTAP